MEIKDIKSVYFIGIGGIGMSALARYFLSKGKYVAGYDLTRTDLTAHLEQENARIHYEDDVMQIPEECKNPDNTLVIFTPAIPKDHSELNYFISRKFTIEKRAQVLGIISKSTKALCVAGTHGKTTTSTMLAHILKSSKADCNAFLGGISKNYDSNLLLSPHSEYTVIEADEFDRSFHWLSPYITTITSVDADHLDIYGTAEAYRESFSIYTSLIKEDGCLLKKKGIPLHENVKEGVKVYTYSAKEPADFHARNIRTENGEIYYDFIGKDVEIENIRLGVPAYVNVENSVAAIAMSLICGVSPSEAKHAIETYKGVDRRFDFKIKSEKTVFINDYAHHPEEIANSIKSIKALYPGRHVTGIFQPHLYSRTKDFYKEFAGSLSMLDTVILLPIYPARELPIKGITSELIYNNLKQGVKKILCSKEELLSLLKSINTDILVTLGAGDIDNLVEPIKDMLLQKEEKTTDSI